MAGRSLYLGGHDRQGPRRAGPASRQGTSLPLPHDYPRSPGPARVFQHREHSRLLRLTYKGGAIRRRPTARRFRFHVVSPPPSPSLTQFDRSTRSLRSSIPTPAAGSRATFRELIIIIMYSLLFPDTRSRHLADTATRSEDRRAHTYTHTERERRARYKHQRGISLSLLATRGAQLESAEN
jgi:hypothetical protein